MTDLQELIKRLEEAEEGSREFDKEIRIGVVGFNPDADLPTHWPMVGDPGPRYTTSIDAALTLVPEGWGYTLHGRTPEFGFETALFKFDEKGTVTTSEEMSTMPLSICAAALRAREAEDENIKNTHSAEEL